LSVLPVEKRPLEHLSQDGLVHRALQEREERAKTYRLALRG
jgi:hypothetical protein